ncbi:MAG: hypothetical protein NC211_02740 [Alistipes senegalensis]|nr:hypothetical protein [Oxalobacter formigenes]MCM1280741.1 hypothetical protein [Alistipes senegalensis]
MKAVFSPYTWYDQLEIEPYRLFVEQAADTIRAVSLMLDMSHSAFIRKECCGHAPALDDEGIETCLLGSKQITRLLEEKALDLITRHNRHIRRKRRKKAR